MKSLFVSHFVSRAQLLDTPVLVYCMLNRGPRNLKSFTIPHTADSQTVTLSREKIGLEGQEGFIEVSQGTLSTVKEVLHHREGGPCSKIHTLKPDSSLRLTT